VIRIIHLSDLHVSTDPLNYKAPFFSGLEGVEVDSYFCLAEAANFSKTSNLAPPPNAVHCIISGDLSASGRSDELRTALNLIRSKVLFNDDTPLVGLEYDKDHYHMVLGNHDIWGGKSPLLAWFGAKAKKHKAQQVKWQPCPTGWRTGDESTFVDTGGLRVRVYLLDSTLPGLRNTFARGRIDQAQLEKLHQLVLEDEKIDEKSKRIKACLRIAVLHHPIHAPSRYIIKMLLERAEQVQAVLDDLSFGLVLCGHEHICELRELSPGLWQAISGTATQTTKDRNSHEFLVYDIIYQTLNRSPSCSILVRKFTRPGTQRSQFTAQPGSSINPKVVSFVNSKKRIV
jgi:3',5'-cyclic AMP phosphodiesterase CpdA